jgi:carboxypeptidase family protein
MRRPAVLVLAAVFAAALAVTGWLVRELRHAQATSGVAAAPALPPPTPPALASGAADRLPSRATATPGAPGAIEGLVTSESGAPLAGVRVQLASRGDGQSGLEPVEVRTGLDGRYALEGVEPGRAVLVAAPDGTALGASRAVRVAAGRAVAGDLTVPEPGVLSGLVTGAEVPTVVVVAPLHPGPGGARVARAPLDPAGAYRLRLPAGQYRVHTAPAASPRADLRVTPAFTAVEAGKTTRLDLAAAPPVEEAGVAVRVLEPGGAPSPGAAVQVARAGDSRVAFAASASDDGVLRIAAEMGMTGQAVTLSARSGGRLGAFTGTLPASGEVVVRLQPGGAVEGTVAGGAAAGGVVLEVASAPSPGGWRTVDVLRLRGEQFDLGDLPPEPVRLTARAAGGRVAQAELTPVPGQVAKVTLTLARPRAPASR